MKRLLIPTMAVFMTLSASSAFAGSVSDKIKSIDPAAHTVTLNDDQVYSFSSVHDLSKLKAGDMVKITFDVSDGKNQATVFKTSVWAIELPGHSILIE